MSKNSDRIRKAVGRVAVEVSDHPCLYVVALSPDGAREFFGMPDAYVEDGGPPADPEKHKPEARRWNVWPKGKPAGA